MPEQYGRWLLDRGRRPLVAGRNLLTFGWKLLTFGWNHERIFLVTLVLLELFFARRTFQGGIWADNDSVCHYAYLRHLLEEVFPATGTFLSYSPKFNMGVPFLLYNTPPGLYVISAIVATILPITALTALKICVVIGFLSVPLLGYAIARTFDDAPRDTPKFVAMLLAFYSSELYGLEFFFKNGMLNPAIGVPFMLATMYFFRRAQRAPFPTTLRYVALAAFFFACTACTHLLSTYMLCLALGGFVLGRRPKNWGPDVFRLGGTLALGGALSAFWLIPSAPFAAAEDAAYTWLRRPQDIVSSFFDGSLLSSYFAGFFPRFVAISNVGIVAIVLGIIAIAFGVQRRASGPLSAFFVFALGFWITLGPACSFGIKLLPGYDRLLWYRFLTITEIGWLILAGFGAAYIAHLGAQFHPYNRIGLVLGFGWMILVMTERATKIETADDYPSFVADVDQAADWLKKHGDKRGRIFSEFLGQAVIQPVSVNYTRHMMPILSGFDEIGGWIYENNLASQELMKKGVIWNSPFPMIDQAPEYNVKYILAGSPHLIRALSFDPRWRSVLSTRDLVLFENAAYEPALAEGAGLVGNPSTQRYLRGGGYEYVIDLTPAPSHIGEGPLVVKVGYLPYFTVYADDDVVPTKPSPDGLLEIELPPGRRPHRLRCVWDIGALRAKGNNVSFAGLALALVLIGASFVKRRPAAGLERPIALLGTSTAALALVAVGVRDRGVDLSSVGFGVRNGIAPYVDGNAVKVGAYDDDRSTSLVHVLTAAWGERSVVGRESARRLLHFDHAALRLALPRRGATTLVFRGEPVDAKLDVTLEVPGGATTCTVHGAMNEEIPLPPACTSGELVGMLPGVTRDVLVRASAPIDVLSVTANTGISVVEAESLRNVVDDGGYEAFYSYSAIETLPSNGLVMIAETRVDKPVDLEGRRRSPAGRVEVWLLTRTLHRRFYDTRAELTVYLDDKPVGSTRGEARTARDFWERDTIFEWIRVGEADVGEITDVKLRLAKIKGAVAGLADVDTLAIVPM